MYSLNEALARERMYEVRRSAERARLAGQLRSARRLRRLERLAQSVHQRVEEHSPADRLAR